MPTILQDLRYGVRILLKRPGFTSIVVLTLALGIGANTAIFSVVYALLLRPLPYLESGRLARLSERLRDGSRDTVSYPNFNDWSLRAQSFEAMAAIRSESFNLVGTDSPVRLRGRMVSWNFFQLLGISPQIGRLFTKEDDQYGAARTVLIDNGIWRERFGGDPSIAGRTISLDGETYTVVGVLPPGFEYFQREDVYVPIGLSLAPRSGMTDRGSSMGGMHVVARLKSGVSLEQADSEMARLGTQLAHEYPATNGGKSAMAQQLQDVMSEEVRQSLWVLLGAVGFILLIACVNVANLLLARAADRQKEITLRLALGARRGRIIRQLLSESLLIALLGGVAGLLLGRWLLDGLLALAPRDIPQLSRVSLDSSVLFFTLGVTVLTGMMCGLLPALYASRTDLHAGLKQGGRSTSSSSREWTGKTLLIAEVSLALVLLAGAGLLVRSMVNLLHVDPGFKTDHLLTMRLNLRGENYNDPRRRVFYEECLARITALPGVRSAAFTIALPIDGSYWDSAFIAADKTVPALADMPGGSLIPVSADYLETMGIRLLNGRWFTSADTTNSAPVTVINEKLARRLWPGENPIGKRLRHGRPENQTPWREVVGVVADVKLNGIERDAPLEMYMPLLQEPQNSLGLAVRTSGDPLAAVTAVERAIHSLDKDVPLFSIRSMDQLLGGSLTQRWLTLVLLAGFALLALLLAAIGIYGVIAYSVRQRTHEIGVRIALGAQAGDVLHLVLKQGMRLALMGTAIGLAGALALTRLMMPLLFNVKPIDPLTFAAITAMLALTALMACWIPARRATKVNPITALRFE